MKKRIFVFLTSLCMMCCMMLMPVQVVVSYAAADDVLYLEDTWLWYGNSSWQNVYSSKATSYNSELDYYTYPSKALSDIFSMSVGELSTKFTDLIYLPQVYDYYLFVTAYSLTETSSFTFKPVTVQFAFENCDEISHSYIDNLEYYHHDKSDYYTGYTVVGKVPELTSTSVSYVDLIDKNGGTVPAEDINIKVQIIQVSKDSEIDFLSDLSEKLDEINESINIQSGYVSNIINSGLNELESDLEQNHTEQMQQSSEQHEEVINGYEDTTVSEANVAFSSESDKLTTLESELSGISNQYISDYTAEGFDLGILATLSSTFSYIATWIANFWNMGGIFTKGINFCLALSIAFTILRLK